MLAGWLAAHLALGPVATAAGIFEPELRLEREVRRRERARLRVDGIRRRVRRQRLRAGGIVPRIARC